MISRLAENDVLVMMGVALVILIATVVRVIQLRRRGLTIRLQLFFALVLSTVAMTLLFASVIVAGEVYILWRDGELSGPSVIQIIAFNLPNVAFVTIVFAASAGVASIIIGRTVTNPIEGLTQRAERIAEGEPTVAPPELPRVQEVRKLTVALESMQRELEQRHLAEALATDLSHELRNPVASIRAAAEVFADAVADDPQKAAHFARRIVESANRLDALVVDLLQLARLEALGPIRADSQVDLARIAADSLEAHSARAAERDVRLERTGEEHAVIRGDEQWLRRALDNLVANAIAFAPDGSRVGVHVESNGEHLVIEVTDEGPGVDDAIADRIFERFMTTRQEDGGTGLGLAIVRAVAEAHGGYASHHKKDSDTAFALHVPR